MQIIEGGPIAKKILLSVAKETSLHKHLPGLAAILVGENEASKLYVQLKKKTAQKVGIFFSDYVLSEEMPEEAILEVIDHLNNDEDVDGILVQLPLPSHIRTENILGRISPEKDVDGLTKENAKKQRQQQESFTCPFPQAIVEIILAHNKEVSGKSVFVLGNSHEFLESMQFLLEQLGMKVISCLFGSQQEKYKSIASCDVIVSAVGVLGSFPEDRVKDGTLIVDGGIERDEEGKVRGDIISEHFKDRDVTISPVPGGVGPITVACLMKNVLESHKRKNHA